MCIACQNSKPTLRLSNLVSDDMVLQQDTLVNIWGYAKPDLPIQIKPSWSNEAYTTVTNSNGHWKTQVPTNRYDGKTHSLKIEADTTLIVNDIVFGEVWLCSGQSNMEFRLDKSNTAQKDSLTSNISNIRLFQVDKTMATVPRDTVSGHWQKSDWESAKTFSAVAYHFGKKLHEELNVPIGLIHASWGGTPVEAWTSNNALKDFEFIKSVEQEKVVGPYANLSNEEAVRVRDSLIKAKTNQLTYSYEKNIGIAAGWMKSNYDDTSWSSHDVPTIWGELEDSKSNKGVIWFRKKITIPNTWKNKELKLDLGVLDERNATYVNGTLVGAVDDLRLWNTFRTYTIPAALIDGDTVVIAVRMTNLYGEAGFVSKAEDVKIYVTDMPENYKSLSGSWRYKMPYTFPELPPQANQQAPSMLFNGMIHPLVTTTLRGVCWYQGENNTGNAKQYDAIFPAMIKDWRTHFEQKNMPFYFVQIAPYNYGDTLNNAAKLRQAQLNTFKDLKHTGMVVTTDIGDIKDIHPTNKKEVGLRLARWALHKNYGKKNLVPSGPLYTHYVVEGSSVRVYFDHAQNGLLSTNGTPSYFEVAGVDDIYYDAEAKIEDTSIVVSSDKVKEPKNVRFGFKNNAEPNLFNSENLPASPFATSPDILKE